MTISVAYQGTLVHRLVAAAAEDGLALKLAGHTREWLAQWKLVSAISGQLDRASARVRIDPGNDPTNAVLSFGIYHPAEQRGLATVPGVATNSINTRTRSLSCQPFHGHPPLLSGLRGQVIPMLWTPFGWITSIWCLYKMIANCDRVFPVFVISQTCCGRSRPQHDAWRAVVVLASHSDDRGAAV